MITSPNKTISTQQLLTDLQSLGMRMENYLTGADGRKGGAGPSDHKAIRIHGQTIMVPIYNDFSSKSDFLASEPNEVGVSVLYRAGEKVSTITFPKQPNFYKHFSSDGVPFWKIAQLHSHNVLATTVLQNCIRYNDKTTSCQFCAIGESLKNDRTIAFKKPHHLAEVAKLAVELDGIEQMVITTGTPASDDRGCKLLYESVLAIKKVVDIPIQVQCEPPEDFGWFRKLKDAGAVNLGMHLESVTQEVRQRIMPGKAEVSIEFYLKAYQAAVEVFGRGQVSTYILAGLGDSAEDIISMSKILVEIGVYPFVVPFTPIVGTPLAQRASPTGEFMYPILKAVGNLLHQAGMNSENTKAGCAKCGACTTLKNYEKQEAHGI